MRVKTIKYGRVKNLGNYQTERVEVEVDVDQIGPESEAVAAALAHARSTVFVSLGLNLPKPSLSEVAAAREVIRRREACR